MPNRSRQLWMLKCWILQKPSECLSMIRVRRSFSLKAKLSEK